MSEPATAALSGVSRATVYGYLELDKQGELIPKPHLGQARGLDPEGCRKLVRQVEENADLTLEEHAKKFSEHGISFKKSSIGNYVLDKTAPDLGLKAAPSWAERAPS